MHHIVIVSITLLFYHHHLYYYRNQCEELRGTLSKRHQDEVCVERLEQLRLKAAMEEEKKAEEQMYADLWYKDIAAKAEREELEAKAQHARNQDVLRTLQIQKASLEAQKDEARRLKQEEARLLVNMHFFCFRINKERVVFRIK